MDRLSWKWLHPLHFIQLIWYRHLNVNWRHVLLLGATYFSNTTQCSYGCFSDLTLDTNVPTDLKETQWTTINHRPCTFHLVSPVLSSRLTSFCSASRGDWLQTRVLLSWARTERNGLLCLRTEIGTKTIKWSLRKRTHPTTHRSAIVSLRRGLCLQRLNMFLIFSLIELEDFRLIIHHWGV